MLVRLLGSVEVASREGLVRAGPAKRGCVLAALAVTPGAPVSIDRLIDRVWGQEPPSAALSVLYGHIARLRSLLSTVADAEIRRAGAGAYLLEIDPERVDLLAFRSLAAQGRRSAETDLAEAVAVLRRAVNLARGEALTGVDGDWAGEVRAGFQREYLATLDSLFAAELSLGNHAAITGELSELLARYPLNEPLTGHLMTGLCRNGQPTEALECFTQLRSGLRNRLGTDPSPALHELHRRILNQDPELAPAASSPPPAAVPAAPAAEPPRPSQLPADTATFTGRDTLVDQLCSTPSEVVVIDGMPGAGKTSLAVHIGHRLSERYPDGRLFIDLHGFSGEVAPITATAALERMLRGCGVPAEEIPAHVEERSALLRSTLTGRRMLLVLDNAADAEQVQPLLPGDSGCLVLITSRRRLTELVDAQPFSLSALDIDAAVRLFVEVAGIGGLPAEQRTAVVPLVERCGLLPLAVRIAASRLRNRPHWTCQDLLDRLSRPGRLLTELGGEGRGVAAAFDMSVRELTPAHRDVFLALSGYPGPDFSAHAAAALTGESVATIETLLEDLLDSHLLMSTVADRYHFHDLVRQYASTLAANSDSRGQIPMTRLADFYVATARQAIELVNPYISALPNAIMTSQVETPTLDDQARAVDWFQSERANFPSLVDKFAKHGLDGHLLALCAAASGFLSLYGNPGERLSMINQALDVARRLGDRDAEGRFANHLGAAYLSGANHSAAITELKRGLELRRTAASSSRSVPAILNNLGRAYGELGDHRRSVEYFDQTMASATSPAARSLWGLAASNSCDHLLAMGLVSKAKENVNAAMALFRELGHEREIARVTHHLGKIAQWEGDFVTALKHHEAVLAYCERYAEPVGLAATLCAIGICLNGLGRSDEAIEHHHRAIQALGTMEDQVLESELLANLGYAELAAGDPESARQTQRAALEMAGRVGARYIMYLAQLGIVMTLPPHDPERRKLVADARAYATEAGLWQSDDERALLAE